MHMWCEVKKQTKTIFNYSKSEQIFVKVNQFDDLLSNVTLTAAW